MEVNKIRVFEETKEEKLSNLLRSFGVKSEWVTLSEGKFIDTYDIKLTDGVKSSKLDKILLDIGISLSALSHPIGSPVMRDGVYRIEVQKGEITCPPFEQLKSEMPKDYYAPIVLGVDSRGENLFCNLNNLPNLLIGGTTGSGKSVIIHNIILSLLKSSSIIYIVDPKMVEFSGYVGIGGVKSVVHSAEECIDVIKKITDIMTLRFKLLKASGSRDVSEYNLSHNQNDALPPIALIIDEWADISLKNKKVQEVLCALAQKCRAAGISIILATQRPSANVLSGIIKANFSGRIALRAASSIDSRVIIESSGAEMLTGAGSALYLDQTMQRPTMFRVPMVSNIASEINLIKKAGKKQTFWGRFFR